MRRRRADHVEARGTDEAGLHAIGAVIATDQLVVAHQRLLAGLEPLDREIWRVLRELGADRLDQQRQVAGRGVLVGSKQPVGIGPVRAGHAKPLRLGVHALDKGVLGAADILADRHGDVIGRPDQHHLQRIVERHDRAGLEAHLARRLGGGMCRHLDRRSERQLAGGNRAEGDVGRHQFGERGGIPALKSLLVLEHLAGGEVE